MLSFLTVLVLSSGIAAEKLSPPDQLPLPPAGHNWKLTWHDEFDGNALDETRWECPPDAPRRDGWWMRKAVSLDSQGHLVMKTFKDGDKLVDGCVRTRGKFEHAFGYYVARMKLHKEPGHWPAFWLMGSTVNRVGDDGRDGSEIDIMEKPWLDGQLNHAIHWDGYDKHHKSASSKPSIDGLMEGWHTYSLLWSPDEYVFYVDGKETWRTKAGGVCQAPLFIKISDEIGKWGGDIAKANLPDEFLVDYVRVYDLDPPATQPASSSSPKFIFDTDMGNDIDDALALGVIHALQSRNECELLAVTLSKGDEFGAPFVDALNTFYKRPDIPIGVVRNGKTPEPGKYTRAIATARDGEQLRYPHDLMSGKDAPEAVSLFRQILAKQPDESVIFVVVGFSTNIARLLETGPDEYSPLNGRELVAQKCRLLSIMGGGFGTSANDKEYNIVNDLPAAQRVFANWPTPIVASGFEVGLAITYPAASIEKNFGYVKHHPLAEAYRAFDKMPYDRPTWDLTSVLHAVRPDKWFFGLSGPGQIRIDDQGHSVFTPSADGKHRYLTVDEKQKVRVRKTLAQLASQPPDAYKN